MRQLTLVFNQFFYPRRYDVIHLSLVIKLGLNWHVELL